MQPNDLPIVCLPLELFPQAAAELLEFLHELADAIERHYGAQIKRHYDDIARANRYCGTAEPPF